MRLRRLSLIFLAFYLTFLGGGGYYTLIFPVRVAHHLIITLLLSLWLIQRIRTRPAKGLSQPPGLPDTGMNLPLYALAGLWLLTAAVSLDPRMAFEHVWFGLIHVLFFFYIVDLLQRGWQRMVIEAVIFMATLTVFITGLELASWYFGLGIVPGTEIGWISTGRLPALTDFPVVSMAIGISTLLAGYTAPLVVLTATWALTTSRRNYRVVLVIITGLLLLTLLFTSSRGGGINIMAAAGTFILLRAAQYPPLTRRIKPIVILGSGIVAGLLVIGAFVAITLPAAKGQSNEGRLDMWRSAIAITADYPLTGVGPGLYGRALRDYRDPQLARDQFASAHNLYLNIAAEIGIPGLLLCGALLAMMLRLAWRNWQTAPPGPRRIRIEGCLAALVGMGVHSLVDVFTITPIVLIFLVLFASIITPLPASRLDPVPPGQPLPAWIALVLVLFYGLAFIQFDRAQAIYIQSMNPAQPETALTGAREAEAIDPHLNLYDLHIALLTGLTDDTTAAITAYEHALQLEPTWYTGWINLAALLEHEGDYERALSALETAVAINPLKEANLPLARLGDSTGLLPDEVIIDRYLEAIRNKRLHSDFYLPLAMFWSETPLRRTALDRYIEGLSVDAAYRVLSVHAPEKARDLVPATPETAAEWWVRGQHILTVEDDPIAAVDAFTQAIERAPTVGDYYVSRARALSTIDPIAAEADLDRAQFYGTLNEYPRAVRAELVDDPARALQLKASALPIRNPKQEFAAVLYTRPAIFDILPTMRDPGPGEAAMQPWFDVAFTYLDNGDTEAARRAFEFIYQNAPYNETVLEMLAQLES